MKEKQKYSTWDGVKYMIRTAWDHRPSVLILCVLLALVEVGIHLVNLYIAPEILSRVEDGGAIGSLLWAITMFSLMLFLLMGLKKYIEINRLFGQIDIRQELLKRVTHQSIFTSYPNAKDPAVLKKKEAAYMTVMNNFQAGEHLWQTMSALLKNILGFIIYLCLLSNVQPGLILMVLVTTIISFFVSRYAGEWEYHHREQRNQYLNEISYVMNQSQSHVLAKDIRIFGLYDWIMEVFQKSLHLYQHFIQKRENIICLAGLVDVLLSLARHGIAYVFLIYLTLSEGWSASEFLLYFGAINGFTNWITGILGEMTTLHREGADLSSLLEYLDLEEPFQFQKGKAIPKADHYELKLEDVSFTYPGSEKKILDHLNLTVHADEKLAVVGLNGAGKTTLVRLLCGFYDPDEGRVLLNGEDIRQYDRQKYYALFSAVFQEYDLLSVNFTEFVSQSVENIDEKKVRQCLEQAGLLEKIETYPQQLQTHIGRDVYLDGVLLSGGETQRLMLARALYKDGPILVLDEPTAALDPLAENDIYHQYHDMTAGKTSIFISHRLASTRFCDRIIYVSNGKILEEGTHDELMASNGRYAKLFEVQSRYYQEGGDWHEYENVTERDFADASESL